MSTTQSAVAKIRRRATDLVDLAGVNVDNGKTLVTLLRRSARTSLATCADAVWILGFEADAIGDWLRANARRTQTDRARMLGQQR